MQESNLTATILALLEQKPRMSLLADADLIKWPFWSLKNYFTYAHKDKILASDFNSSK